MAPDLRPSTEAVRAIAERIRQRRTQIGAAMIDRYRSEIPEYAALDDQLLANDVLRVSLDNLDSLLDRVVRGGHLDEAALESFRLAAARRVHQGVSIESLLHAYRLWVQILWGSILEEVSDGAPDEQEAALALAGRVMEHLNVVSTASTRAYLDELEGLWSDREVLLRELFEEMVAGRGSQERATNTALAMEVDLWEDYLVVLAKRPNPAVTESGGDPLLAGRRLNRRALDSARALLRPARGTLLTGVRRDEVIALYPLVDQASADKARSQVGRFAQAVARDAFSVGLGGPRHGREQVSQSFQEAREAATIASEAGTVGVAVAFDDVLIDYVLRSNPLSERLAESTIGRLASYDRDHHSDLVETARVFVACRFSLTKTASRLSVHPNTVVYRLKRIRDITGRDLQDPEDLVAFTVALRVSGRPNPSVALP